MLDQLALRNSSQHRRIQDSTIAYHLAAGLMSLGQMDILGDEQATVKREESP